MQSALDYADTVLHEPRRGEGTTGTFLVGMFCGVGLLIAIFNDVLGRVMNGNVLAGTALFAAGAVVGWPVDKWVARPLRDRYVARRRTVAAERAARFEASTSSPVVIHVHRRTAVPVALGAAVLAAASAFQILAADSIVDTIIGVVAGVFFWPAAVWLVRASLDPRPVLAADEQGLQVRGLPELRWEEVEQLRARGEGHASWVLVQPVRGRWKDVPVWRRALAHINRALLRGRYVFVGGALLPADVHTVVAVLNRVRPSSTDRGQD